MKNVGIVVGGSSGIGSAICSMLSQKYNIVNMSRRENILVDNIFMDVSDLYSVKSAFGMLNKNYSNVEFMIYCSGFVEPQGLLELDEDILRKTIDTNLIGAILCTKEFVKINKNNKNINKILYIASTAGTRPQPGWLAYASSKAGLINFSLTMNEELKDYNIKTYCISPGRCATPLREILAPNEDQTKIMQPEEIAEFVQYLICEDKILDGQNIINKKITR